MRAKPKVAIVGVGLIGGSLGLALVRSRRWRVAGVGRRLARLKLAKRRGSVHEVHTDLAAGVRGAAVVVLAAPVDEIVPLAKRLRPHLESGALVTDAGSVKAAIVRPLEKVFGRGGPDFVGAHPMAGSEKTGVEHARADLFRGATCVVTPGRNARPAAVRRAESFWRAVGARVVRLDPETHDRWAALVSHLPHLVADSLVLTAAAEPGAAAKVPLLAAGSFRDATRVAGADPAQWNAIFGMNAAPLSRAAAAFGRTLNALVRTRYPLARLERAARSRDILMKRPRR